MELILDFLPYPTPLVEGAHHGLASGVNVDVFDDDVLLAFRTVPLQGVEVTGEGPWSEAKALQCPLPDGMLTVVATTPLGNDVTGERFSSGDPMRPAECRVDR